LFFFFILSRPPPSTLFPYTTLFRSANCKRRWPKMWIFLGRFDPLRQFQLAGGGGRPPRHHGLGCPAVVAGQIEFIVQASRDWSRSEEHTSELQSRFDLVCRLLLEKK